MKKRVAVLGATGSIGKSSLDVLSGDRDNFEVVLLSAHNNCSALEECSHNWPDARCVLSGKENGKENLLAAIREAGADITINGIAGGAGLEPSMAAIESGSDLALANKETVVMAGPLVFRTASEKNVKIIPVDSEHSAVFHLMEAFGSQNTAEIILTASGGPFRSMSLKEMESASPEAALAHPTWNMGPKISVDSASMANKGLEIIEAVLFFNMPQENIKVTIHPQSIVHSRIRLKNGIIYAQLSRPDMRHPIHDALYWPKTEHSDLQALDFESLTLEFIKPDIQRFPMLGLAREAARQGGLYPCALNAANETAVAAFLRRETGFLDIPRIVGYVLERNWAGQCDCIETVIKADKDARSAAETYLRSA